MRDLFLLRKAPIDKGRQHPGLHPHMTPQHDIVEHRHAAEERDVLERAGDAEHGDLRWAGAGDVLALEDDRAGVGPVEPADHVEEGSLAGAVWANDRDEPAAADG